MIAWCLEHGISVIVADPRIDTESRDALERARDGHRRILALYPRIAERRIYFRRQDKSSRQSRHKASERIIGVERDRMICALLNKAANTKRAIVTLCDTDLSDDAMSLCRVLLENSVQLQWMLHDDWVSRVDTYSLFAAALSRRIANVSIEHFSGTDLDELARTTLADTAAAAAVDDVFSGKWMDWARFDDPARPGKIKIVKLRDMIEELDPKHVGMDTGHVAFAGAYLDGCHYVHSLPPSLLYILKDLENAATYELRERSRSERALYALQQSNFWTLMAIAAVNDRLGVGLDEEIQAILEFLKDLPQTSDGESP